MIYPAALRRHDLHRRSTSTTIRTAVARGSWRETSETADAKQRSACPTPPAFSAVEMVPYHDAYSHRAALRTPHKVGVAHHTSRTTHHVASRATHARLHAPPRPPCPSTARTHAPPQLVRTSCHHTNADSVYIHRDCAVAPTCAPSLFCLLHRPTPVQQPALAILGPTRMPPLGPRR